LARLRYLPAAASEPAELVAAMRRRRGGELLNLDRMLLHAPGYAAGWNALITRLRTDIVLPERLAELGICAVAVLTGAEYEWHHHGPRLLAAGAGEAQLAALRAGPERWTDESVFDAGERALLALARAMTEHLHVPDSVFSDARQALGGERELVEAVGVIATYNMVSRFLLALGVEPE